jgi:hypothetical protein
VSLALKPAFLAFFLPLSFFYQQRDTIKRGKAQGAFLLVWVEFDLSIFSKRAATTNLALAFNKLSIIKNMKDIPRQGINNPNYCNFYPQKDSKKFVNLRRIDDGEKLRESDMNRGPGANIINFFLRYSRCHKISCSVCLRQSECLPLSPKPSTGLKIAEILYSQQRKRRKKVLTILYLYIKFIFDLIECL